MASADGDARSLTRQGLYDLVWARPMALAAADFGVSRNGLAKICDRLLIPYPGRGHWTRSGCAKSAERPPLPSPPDGVGETVTLAAARSASRRTRTRFSLEARRDQLIEAAAVIVGQEGAHAATMKRLARDVGISEAQAHNYFSRRTDLLTALARRELDAMEEQRETEMERAQSSLARVIRSTETYLRQVAERGALIQALLNIPEVRAGLRAGRQAKRDDARRRMGERLHTRYGVPDDTARGMSAVLTAVCLRAGRLLAEGKIDLAAAERLSLAIVAAGNRRITAATRPPKPAPP